MSQPRADVAIIGGGPGGYEAALVAAQLGARVTVVEADGLGGACVLTDCVPSKTLIATSETMGILAGAAPNDRDIRARLTHEAPFCRTQPPGRRAATIATSARG